MDVKYMYVTMPPAKRYTWEYLFRLNNGLWEQTIIG